VDFLSLLFKWTSIPAIPSGHQDIATDNQTSGGSQSAISNQQSAISNQQSAISNQQSAVSSQ
jgi:hypothetical protein